MAKKQSGRNEQDGDPLADLRRAYSFYNQTNGKSPHGEVVLKTPDVV